MTKDDPHSPEAEVERIVRRTVPDHFRDCAKWRSQLRIALLDGGLCFRPGDRPREGLVVVPEDELRLVASRLSTTIETAQSFDLQLAPIRTVKEQIDAMLTAASEPEDSHE